MLAEVRTRSQITIPAKAAKEIGIKEGDKLEVVVKDGRILLIPVVVYPRKSVDKINDIIKNGDFSKEFDSIDALIADLRSDDE